MLESGDERMMMKAVLLHKPSSWEELKVSEVPVPKVKPGWVLIKVMAFGLNHSELVLRKNEIKADYIKKPVIPGIECVGFIEDKSDSHFENGDQVVALMGGMGRSFDGSYCQYALLPEHHVFFAPVDLDWVNLAAVPETFFTAYGSVIHSLKLKSEDVLLVHGGTSALGLAAIAIAKTVGCKVLATTRQPERLAFLESVGVTTAFLDNETLYEEIDKDYPSGITKVLELINETNISKMGKILGIGGVVCVTGQLGSRVNGNFDMIKHIPNGCYVTSFHSNDPNQEDLNKVFRMIDEYKIQPIIGKVFTLDEIAKAHEYLEMHYVPGKLIVTL